MTLSRRRVRLTLLLVPTVLMGCTDKGSGPVAPSTCEAVSRVAQLYPSSLHAKTQTRERVAAVDWARRDGGRGAHDTSSNEVWHRNHDLSVEPVDRGFRVSYQEEHKSSEAPAETKTWENTCEICGDVMVCGDDQIATLRVRDGELERRAMTWLDTTAMVPIGDHAYYLIRFDHEIALRFDHPPGEGSGQVQVQTRALKPGAPVNEQAVSYTSEQLVSGSSEHRVDIELPSGIGALRIRAFADEPARIFVNDHGARDFLHDTLMDAVKLALHPSLGRQPAMP